MILEASATLFFFFFISNKYIYVCRDSIFFFFYLTWDWNFHVAAVFVHLWKFAQFVCEFFQIQIFYPPSIIPKTVGIKRLIFFFFSEELVPQVKSKMAVEIVPCGAATVIPYFKDDCTWIKFDSKRNQR